MRRRTPLSTLLVFAVVLVGSLGASDCSDDLIARVARMLADHERRIRALERCECEGVVAPVCGEDSRTYLNACEAACADVRVESSGRCAKPDCGGPEGIACDTGRFCETRPGCDALAFGICEEIPTACTEEFAPVCGCDGVTYSNDCERRAAGVPLDFRGDCAEPPLSCDDNDDCRDGEFCRKRKGVCDEEPGLCAPIPEECTRQYDPVCGCDGKTYSNACVAASAGVSVAHEGACEPGPAACHDNSDCEAEEYCRKRIGHCHSDGSCQPRPLACPLFIAPVCGCDGNTYDNECAAAFAGVSLADDEACDAAKVPICHVPPGNLGNRHTIFVGDPAVPAHLAHGDSRGHCDDDDDDDWDND